MQSFSGLIESIIEFVKNILNEYIFYSSGNNWITDTTLYHLILVIVITTIFSLIFNKLILVFVRSSLKKINFTIGQKLLDKKVLIPIGWAMPIIIFEAGLGSYSPDEGIIARLTQALLILVFILSITRLLSAI